MALWFWQRLLYYYHYQIIKKTMITPNTPTDKNNKDWESLKEGNPWHKIFDPKTEELLERLLKNDEGFIYSGDKDIILDRNNVLEKKGKKDKMFVTSLLPKPYRGNLKDPKLVILSLNPGYKKRVKKTLFTLLEPKYQRQFIEITKENALLEAPYIISPIYEVDDVMDNGYWSSRLEDLKRKGVDLSKIGLIQYIPYASKQFDSWGDDAKLKTQVFTIKIIQHLLHETDAFFLVMRSREQWEKLIGKEMDNYKDQFFYCKNPRCQKISPNNLQEGQYEKIVEKLKNNL